MVDDRGGQDDRHDDERDSDPEVLRRQADDRDVRALTEHTRHQRPWLDSTARQSALDALTNSPLRQSPVWFLRTWDTVEARATHIRFLAGEVSKGTYRSQSAAYIRLAGRRLSMLVGFRGQVLS